MTKDEALAFDLALEALEETLKTLDDANAIPGGPIADTIWYSPYETLFDYLEVQIAAIKQARALDKMAENARELGLDYEPVTTLFGSLPVYDTPPVREDWGPGPHECHSLTAAPVQEPVAWRYRGILHEFDPSDWAEGPVTPLYTTPPEQPVPAQERKPVCWEGEDKCPNRQACCDAQHCLYTTPPAAQRQWVGLTDEEVRETISSVHIEPLFSYRHVARAIEAKLKEKNT